MPTEIVTDTCPAPECNLTDQVIEQFLSEITDYMELFRPAFQRVEQLEWSKVYLRGLLGDASRKSIERIAFDLGEKVRNLDDPTEIKFYFSNAPATTPLIEFVSLSGMSWPIETIFEEAKSVIIRLICLTASPSWLDLQPFQPTLRCNTNQG